MMVLYGTKGSGAAAVDAALRMSGAPYRVVDAASTTRYGAPVIRSAASTAAAPDPLVP